MNAQRNPITEVERKNGRAAPLAFSLIELIGVLAVIAVLAGLLVPVLIRQLDRVAGEQETAALKSFSDAFRQSVLRNRYVPGATDWATNIAGELGVDVANVITNARKLPRFFLIDPSFSIAGAGLPYTQTSTCAVSLPASPRVL